MLGECVLSRLLDLVHVGRVVLDAGWQIETMFLDNILAPMDNYITMSRMKRVP
jgi:hypothetical protein